jgi:pyruvate/2-oxoglutarate/acetoin dehydrogenase E1 component
MIKPLPLQDILPSIRESKKLIIAEEAVCTSGWGAELASQVYENTFKLLLKPIQRIGAQESPIPSSKFLEEKVLPQASDIEAAIYKQIED